MRSERQAVETLQLFGDAATLQKNRLTGHFGGMRGEYRSDLDLPQGSEGILCRHAGFFHAQKRSAKRTGKRSVIAIQFACTAAAFAVIGLGQIGQLEVSREGFGHLIGAGQVHV